MIEIRRILCPVDFSDASQHALDHAAALAKWYDSQVAVLHVLHSPVLPESPAIVGAGALTAFPPIARRESVDAHLEELVERVRGAGVKAEAILDDGNPAARVLETAATLAADLIVMGTHGVTGFERFMLGSVAEKVLRKASCPVVTVPPRAAIAARLPYTRILCPVDFSPSSLSALRFAFSIAEESDAHLTILHMFDWPPDDDLLVERFDAVEFRRVVEEQGRHRLDALVPDEVRVWCKPETNVRYGKPYQAILSEAESESADLIVIGVRGRNAVDVTLFGSTTNQVVRRAPCPVLTLKQ